MVSLASGQEVAAHIAGLVAGFPGPLSSEEIFGVDLPGLSDNARSELKQSTPLWFYILREAELNDGKLGNVGGRIVVETFHRAIEGSAISILRDPSFSPFLGPDSSTFRMTDLLLVAYNASRSELRPLSPTAPVP
jgi:hypothetical protein